jgi:ABC-type transport system involved in cytochrome bd biosynthesis fused ATPase/permease subunit
MLARAAVRDADILLLDEPFEGIDATSRPLVAASIRTIAAGRTTLVVSHVNVAELDPDVVMVVTSEGVRTHVVTA